MTDAAQSLPLVPPWLRSSLRHLRPLNSFHLAPAVLFSLSQAPHLSLERALWIVLIMHAFVYPSSAGYNSYFDRDEKPTGGLKEPPPVHESLYWLVTGLDIVAIALASWLNPLFGLFVVGWTLASRAYSNDRVRLKARPIVGFVWVVAIQGFATFQAIWLGAEDLSVEQLGRLLEPDLLLCGLFVSAMVAGSYPLTQVYQFDEDAARGDTTFSMLLGLRGTFVWSLGALTVAFALMLLYFGRYEDPRHLALLVPLFLPALFFLVRWFAQVWRDPAAANHANAMRMSTITAWCGNAAFAGLLVLNHLPLFGAPDAVAHALSLTAALAG